MMEEARPKVSKETAFGIGIFAIILVGLVVLGLSNFNWKESPSSVSHDHGSDDESQVESELESMVKYQNINFVSQTIGIDGANTALNIFNKIITNDTKPEKLDEYTVSIAGKTINRSTYFPYDTLSFIANISDDRSYNVYFAAQKEYYYGLLICQTYPFRNNSSRLYVVFLKEESTGLYDRDQVISSLIAWAKTIENNTLLLTTEN